jgi:cytochrome c oxidase assembly protein subunit 15
MEFINYTSESTVAKGVKIWLIAGLLMIFFQIVIGGITRLTGSGLSITRWEIVTGSVPPLNEATWTAEFDLYKSTPQYQKINRGMSLEEFKFIYFWEYFHRLWARLMFVVFIVGFTYFLFRGMFSKKLVPRLLWVVVLAGVEGFFGWIMVASGLISRPWVNAYNLTLHLCMALVIFSYLLWTTFIAFNVRPTQVCNSDKATGRLGWIILFVAFFQIALGAMMSGSKAGLSYPTWPDMNGMFIPSILLESSQWHLSSFINYDANSFMPSFIQFFHRNTAYVLTALIFWFIFKHHKHSDRSVLTALYLMGGMNAVQVLLGIITIINCKGTIPVDLGVYHQAGAVLLLSTILWAKFKLR